MGVTLASFLLLLATPAARSAAKASRPPVTFERDVSPIVGRCRPCHFPGGTMYERMPFDDPETVRRAGERLFTRIKDAREQAVVRTFLASSH